MLQEIYITMTDKSKLIEIIDKAANKEMRAEISFKELEAEIKRAKVIDQSVPPFAFVKMNSKVLMTIDHEEEEITLVYPEASDIRNNKISVFSPIGTAILGYREGSCIEWRVPGGTVHIRIVSIID